MFHRDTDFRRINPDDLRIESLAAAVTTPMNGTMISLAVMFMKDEGSGREYFFSLRMS